VLQASRDLSYLVLKVSLGQVLPDASFIPLASDENKYLDSAACLLWASIFSVKVSFLMFFRGLIRRVRKMEIWWWVVMGVVIPSACVCIPLTFIECVDFGPDLLREY